MIKYDDNRCWLLSLLQMFLITALRGNICMWSDSRRSLHDDIVRLLVFYMWELWCHGNAAHNMKKRPHTHTHTPADRSECFSSSGNRSASYSEKLEGGRTSPPRSSSSSMAAASWFHRSSVFSFGLVHTWRRSTKHEKRDGCWEPCWPSPSWPGDGSDHIMVCLTLNDDIMRRSTFTMFTEGTHRERSRVVSS